MTEPVLAPVRQLGRVANTFQSLCYLPITLVESLIRKTSVKLDLVPESLTERLLIAAGLIPRPLAHTMIGMLMSRTILAAARFGVFEALSERPRQSAEIASACGMNNSACKKLMNALCGLGYVRLTESGFELTAMSRKWFGSSVRQDLTDAVLHRYLDMKLMEHSEAYLRSGESVDFHRSLSDDEWRTYVRGQRAQAALTVPEFVKRMPLPDGATSMLDVGGGHGLFADAMCRKYPLLNAVVLDLPGALQEVDASSLSERIRFESGDILDESINLGEHDLVFLGNLLHHFNETRCREIVLRAARAVGPRGTLCVADFFDPGSSSDVSQIPALLDFYFAVTSGGGAPIRERTEGWMRDGGLTRIRTLKMLSVPGMHLVIGTTSGRKRS